MTTNTHSSLLVAASTTHSFSAAVQGLSGGGSRRFSQRHVMNTLYQAGIGSGAESAYSSKPSSNERQ